MRIFISYARSDSEFARKLTADLTALGVEPWIDTVELEFGANFADAITKAIAASDFMFVLVSSRSVLSHWMMSEVNVALERRQRVIPVIIDQESKASIPDRLRSLQWLDLSNPRTYMHTLRDFIAQLNRARADEPRKETGANKIKDQFTHTDMDELVGRIAKEVAERMNLKAEPPGLAGERQERKNGEKPKSVFVVMAFTADMEPIFEGIRDAAASCGLEAKRVKDVVGDYQISNKLISMINEAALVVVDLTHERPNVYFELGFARGAGKKVITTAKEGTNLHFDVRDWTCSFYSDSRVLERTLKERFRIEMREFQ